MTIEPSSEQPYGSISVDPGTSLGQSSDYHFPGFHNPDRNMEVTSPVSPPSTYIQWHPPSMTPPTPAFQFPTLLEDNLPSWSDPHSPQMFSPETQFNDPGNAFHPASYSDGYTQTSIPPANGQLSDRDYIDNLPSTSGILSFPGITVNELPSTKVEQLQVVGNLSDFPIPSSPFGNAASSHLSHGLPVGALPGSCGRAEHEPLTGPYPTQARGYPMHSYESPLSTGDKKNPETMRNSWIADYSRFLDGNKVFKIFSKHEREKVATINTLKASAARRRNPAKFKCSIGGCGADFSRKHNLENHLKSHCGVTDRVCSLCGKGFTTIPVWKRHQQSCEKASSNKAGTSNGFLDAMTAQRHA